MKFGSEELVEEKERRGWWLVFAILALAVGAVVLQFARPVVAEAAACSTFVILSSALTFDTYLQRRSYWLFMTAVVVAQGVLLLLAIRWSHQHHMTKADGLVVAGDLLLVGVTGELVHRLTWKSAPSPPKV